VLVGHDASFIVTPTHKPTHTQPASPAEHTYFQAAIDHTVLVLQGQYNREVPIVFNTYQAYLTDVHERLLLDLERAKREVRGGRSQKGEVERVEMGWMACYIGSSSTHPPTSTHML
jgi:hypothetical protein